eukprot:TRINITY_DN25726_c0_g1_i1.p2 TRINITY_DN25726_c0_g1~~TRINITY_DN25726_c0_g1_i1.p2  ORF type:complete len:172 (+),score=33.97 TRINITY_DN25726_c0_g1_i1:98-613(+)
MRRPQRGCAGSAQGRSADAPPAAAPRRPADGGWTVGSRVEVRVWGGLRSGGSGAVAAAKRQRGAAAAQWKRGSVAEVQEDGSVVVDCGRSTAPQLLTVTDPDAIRRPTSWLTLGAEGVGLVIPIAGWGFILFVLPLGIAMTMDWLTLDRYDSVAETEARREEILAGVITKK